MVLLNRAASTPDEEERRGPTAEIGPELLRSVDPEVIYKRVELPRDRNAFSLIEKAVEKYSEPESEDLRDDISNLVSSDAAFPAGAPGRRIGAAIDRNRTALGFLSQAVLRDGLQYPAREVSIEMELPHLVPLRHLARLKMASARRHVRDGNLQAAVGEVAETIRLGVLMQDADGVLIEYLVGVSIQRMALAEARRLTSQRPLQADVGEQLLASVDEIEEADRGLAQAIRLEFTMLIGVVSRLEEDGSDFEEELLPKIYLITVGPGPSGVRVEPLASSDDTDARDAKTREAEQAVMDLIRAHPKPLDRAATARHLSDFFVRYIRNTGRAWGDQDTRISEDVLELTRTMREALDWLPESRPPTEEEMAKIKPAFSGTVNPLGRALIGLLLGAYQTTMEMQFRSRADRALTAAFIALRCYAVRHRKYPRTLRTLVNEDLLVDVPTDPFNGKAVRYDAGRRALWSVGPDGADDGGTSPPERYWEKDYVVVLPRIGGAR